MASATAQITETEVQFISNNGSNIYQKFFWITSDYTTVAQEGNIVKTRTDNGRMARCYQGGTELFNLDTILKRAKNIGEQAVELLSAPDCPTTTTQVVLAPEQMMLQIHESAGHPLEIDRIVIMRGQVLLNLMRKLGVWFPINECDF